MKWMPLRQTAASNFVPEAEISPFFSHVRAKNGQNTPFKKQAMPNI